MTVLNFKNYFSFSTKGIPSVTHCPMLYKGYVDLIETAPPPPLL